MIGWRRGWRSARTVGAGAPRPVEPPAGAPSGAVDAIDRAIALVVELPPERLADPTAEAEDSGRRL